MKNANAVIEYGRSWAILPAELESYAEKLSGAWMDAETAERVQSLYAARSIGQTVGSVALLPLHGPITKRYGLMSYLFGGTSSDAFGQAFDAAIRNPQVSHIVIDVDSPGGTVSGATELATKIRNARGQKPITAAVNSMAASAAYWVASAADSVMVTPSGEVGSIGVFAIHADYSAAMEREGIKHTIIVSGGSPHKVEGNPYEPITEDAIQDTQASIDASFDSFVSDVAKNRGVSAKVVRETYGKGRMLSARDAASVGMVDGIATLEGVLSRSPKTNRSGRRASMLRRHLEMME